MTNEKPVIYNLLTKREKHLLQYISTGMTSKQIAQELFISKSTIDKHRKNMLKKLGVRNSAQMISAIKDTGWAV
jgi:DNA-binding NarL/FixJ family response regulator